MNEYSSRNNQGSFANLKVETNAKSERSRRDTSDLTQYMANQLMDVTIVERYGTSLKMSMGREYNKYLSDKYEKLKNEFEVVNKTTEDSLNFDELVNFFNNYESKTGVKLSEEYFESLYEYLEHDKNKDIDIQEFILSYMVIEEKLRHKQMHLKQIIDEYNHLKQKYIKSKRENEDEELNSYGVAKNAECFISIISCEDLIGFNYSGRVDPYVSIELENKILNTHFKEDTLSPIFNEELIL